MKRKIFTAAIAIVIVIVIVSTTFLVLRCNEENKPFKKYADFTLNSTLPDVCENMIEMNVIIGQALKTGYISESELTNLRTSFDIYIRDFYQLIELFEITKDFKFHETYKRSDDYKIGFEYSNFFYRIDELFADKEKSDAAGYQLTATERAVFEQSYDYTSKASEVIKQKIEYYNMFNVEPVSIDGAVSYAWRVKEEYKQPIPPNMAMAGAEVSSDGSAENVELDAALAPEKPHFDLADSHLLELLKEIKLLNREKL